MYEVIRKRLQELECTENFRLLYACESGSRAWGFESTDSDYDVRFIYARRRDWYLSLFNKRDVVEPPHSDNLDISGWDLKKALRLFRASNPPLLEWLRSPIVYDEDDLFMAHLRALLPDFYSPSACMHHYLHMAQNNFRQYLRGPEVWVKKYFYVLRPLLAVRWIERHKDPPPVRFADLLDELEPELKAEITKLVDAKRGGNELDRGARMEAIGSFIESELQRLEAAGIARCDVRKVPDEKLDALFISTVS